MRVKFFKHENMKIIIKNIYASDSLISFLQAQPQWPVRCDPLLKS